LNVELQTKVYQLIKESDPNLVLLSVAHRPELIQYHTKILKPSENERYVWVLSDVPKNS